jgi:hypothetical protein
MREVFASGDIAVIALAVLALEIVTIAAWRRWRAVPVHPITLIVAACPGVCLMLALQAALTGAGWMVIAFWLAASFPAHLADLWLRPP